MTISRFSFPTTIHFGPGASRLAGAHLAERGLRRPLDKLTAEPAARQSEPAKPASGMAPLLVQLLARQAAAGLPPPYLPKDEGDDT